MDVPRVIDDLTTTDIGGRETIYPIAEAAAREQGEHPAMGAAELLEEAVDPGDPVIVLTGFPIPPTMIQETDGPPGAVSVARAVESGLDAAPILACDPGGVEICEATATAGGLSVVDRETAMAAERSVAVEAFPADREAAADYARDLADLDPAAVVAVEKVGPNREGVYHNMAGYDVSEPAAKVGELYDRVDAPTVAVGDAGNEVGMGVVEDRVREDIEYGAACQCPCGEGLACALGADVLVPATVSNWGGHAIAACLSRIVGRSLLHEPETERRMLDAAAMAGSVDGIAGGTDGWCDGMPPAAHESVVCLLREALSATVHERGGGELGR